MRDGHDEHAHERYLYRTALSHKLGRVAALLEGHRFVGVELSGHYAQQAVARLSAAASGQEDPDNDPDER